MRHLVKLILVTSIVLSPSLGNGQNGVGGTIVHEPDLGCACIAPFANEVKVTSNGGSQNSSTPARKLSADECRQKGDVAKVYRGAEVDKKATILERPEPQLSSSAQVDVSGDVILQVVLCPNGSVGRIALVLKLSDDLSESAIRAAKKIKFEVAIKNGQPVAQYERLVYSFGHSQ